MKNKYVLHFFILLFPAFLDAQIVNTEKLRINADKDGWSGIVNVNFSMVKNTREILQAGVTTGLEYQKKRHKTLVLGDYTLMKAAESDLLNKGFGHLRYNYRINKWLIPEAFIQGQYNRIQDIRFRGLAGTGPRFQIIQTDSSRLYAGVLYMFEYEELIDTSIIRRDHRISTYLSAGYVFNELLSIDNITYFQPNLRDPVDFRLTSETVFKVVLNKTLSFQSIFQILYDTRPAEGVPEVIYTFKNGFRIQF